MNEILPGNDIVRGGQAMAASDRGAAAGGLVRPVLGSAVLFMLVTGLAYPLATTGAAQLLFRHQARGSLIVRDGQILGSALVGQNFEQPGYFHPRPSATTAIDPADPSKTVAQPYNAASSGASNLGPTSKALIDAVASRVQDYRQENGLAADAMVPVDAVTASGSGLDPDISLANARLQARRIASTRGISMTEMTAILDRHVTPPQLGVLGDPRVNVLELNLALDRIMAKKSSVAPETAEAR
jgi:potassium-transporting ATPase KdpC subunit